MSGRRRRGGGLPGARLKGASPGSSVEVAATPFGGFDIAPAQPPRELVWDGTGFATASSPPLRNRRRRGGEPQLEEPTGGLDGPTPPAVLASPSGGGVGAAARVAPAAPLSPTQRVLEANTGGTAAAWSLGWQGVVLVSFVVMAVRRWVGVQWGLALFVAGSAAWIVSSRRAGDATARE